MSSNLHSISTSCHLTFTASQSHTPSTSRRFMFSCNSVSLCAVKMLHQGAAGAFSWSICCSQWLNHCVKVISISVVFFTLMLWCFSSHGSFSLSWTASRWLRLKCTLVLCFLQSLGDFAQWNCCVEGALSVCVFCRATLGNSMRLCTVDMLHQGAFSEVEVTCSATLCLFV